MTDCPITLFTARDSAASRRAESNLRIALAGRDGVRVRISEAEADPAAARAHHAYLTPMLHIGGVRDQYLFGSLDDVDLVRAIVDHAVAEAAPR